MNEIRKLVNKPYLTTIIRILRASKSKRITEEMKDLPFWGLFRKEKYPSLTSSDLKPFIYPFLISENIDKRIDRNSREATVVDKWPLQYVSTTVLAINHGKMQHELFSFFARINWIEKIERRWKLTSLGITKGGVYKNTESGIKYIAWPENILEKENLIDLINNEETIRDRSQKITEK